MRFLIARLALVGGFMLSACSPASSRSTPQTIEEVVANAPTAQAVVAPSIVPTSTGLPIATSAPTLRLTPVTLPVATLTSVSGSYSCLEPATTVELSDFRVAGSSPIWAAFSAPTVIFGLGSRPPTEYGVARKLLWLVEIQYTGVITVQGGNLDDGTALWFTLNNWADPAKATTTLTLDPQNPPVPLQHPRFAYFPSAVFIPASGCYFLKATWSTGSWQINFTVTD